MSIIGSQKFAVLLCKFHDAPDVEPQPTHFFVDLFMKRGTGGVNDYWMEASLGHINLDGSEVFGWRVLSENRVAFINTHPGRWDKIQGAIAAFPEVDTSKYAGVVAIFNQDPGDAGASGGVLAGPGDTNVTFMAHETGHHLGLEHSFDQSDRTLISWSAPGEYYDEHDVMSAMHVHSDIGHRFSPRGPLLNTANLDRMEWLPAARVWSSPTKNSSDRFQFDLVSLSHPEIPGFLAAKIGGRYIEFRMNERWDLGISRPCVLIHELHDGNSVVVASDRASWNYEWQPGQRFGPSDFVMSTRGGVRIYIESFNLAAKTARISLEVQAGRRLVAGPGRIVGGVAEGGGGWIILPSGRRVPVPPRGPLLDILRVIADVADAEQVPTMVEEMTLTRENELLRALQGRLSHDKRNRGV